MPTSIPSEEREQHARASTTAVLHLQPWTLVLKNNTELISLMPDKLPETAVVPSFYSGQAARKVYATPSITVDTYTDTRIGDLHTNWTKETKEAEKTKTKTFETKQTKGIELRSNFESSSWGSHFTKWGG